MALAVVALVSGMLIWGAGAMSRHITDSLDLLDAKRPYAPQLDFLPEDEALAIARSAMETAGFPADEWVPLEDDRSTAPDGWKDLYLGRNIHDPHSGTITFRNAQRKDWYHTLYVVFQRDDDHLRVRVTRGK